MMRTLGVVAFLCAGAPAAAQQAQVPQPVRDRVDQLVAQCARAGGQLGAMTGQGRFVIPADFDGDGRTDFIVSEGNVPCTGRMTLFRPDGLSRVELWIADGAGSARLAFADRLLAYRVLAGPPARLQIARRGAACGAGVARCGDELRWNAEAQRFEEVATDGRTVEARPATGGEVPASGEVRATAVPAATAAGGVAVPPVQAGAEARFRAACRARVLAESGAQAAKWVDSECAEGWKRAVAAQPLAEALLAAQGAGPGPAERAKRALPMVRWAPRPDQGELASGRIGSFQVGLEGSGGMADRMFGWWRATGAEIPVDLPAALEARGATLTLTSCVKQGVGEGERAWQVRLPGRAPFELFVSERTAPTGGAMSYWRGEVRLDGRPARRGPTRCERFW